MKHRNDSLIHIKMNREFEFIRELWAPTKMDTYVVNKFFCTGAYVKNISLIIILSPVIIVQGIILLLKEIFLTSGASAFVW